MTALLDSAQSPRLERLAALTLAFAIAATLAFHSARALDLSRDEGEGPMLLVAQRMSTGSFPSPDWVATAPYTVMPYGPTFFGTVGALMRVTKSQASLVPGRFVSIAAAALTAWIVAAVVWRRALAPAPGLLVACLFLAYPGIGFWLHDNRVDALAVLFAIAAVAAISPNRARIAAAAILIIVGSTVKQTVALAAAGPVLYLWLRGERRAAALFTAFTAVGGLAVWATLDAFSLGYLLEYGLGGNERRYSLNQAWLLLRAFLLNAISAGALLAFGAALWRNSRLMCECRFATAFITALMVGVALSGSEGAASNYYIEVAALATIVAGVHGVVPLWRTLPTLAASTLACAGLAISLLMTVMAFRGIAALTPPPDFTSFAEGLRSPMVLVDMGLVGAAARSGLQPAVSDPYFFRIAVTNGVFDSARLVASLRRGDVAGLILEHQLTVSSGWPADVQSALAAEFEPVGESGGAFLYRLRRESR